MDLVDSQYQYTHIIHRSPPHALPLLSRPRPHRPPPRRKRNPPPNQAQSSQRRDWPQELEPLRIQHEQIYAPGEHGHSGREERHGERVLRTGDRGEGQDCGVDELCGRAVSMRIERRTGTIEVRGVEPYIPDTVPLCPSSQCAPDLRCASLGRERRKHPA